MEEIFTEIRAKMDGDGMAENVHLEPLLDLLSGSVISELMFGYDFRGVSLVLCKMAFIKLVLKRPLRLKG
jgi:hypothetical protein